MKIGVLTSSRADYGIYKPLLSKLSINKKIDLEIIAFGMHLQKEHGYTIKEIETDRFVVVHKIKGMPAQDSPEDIAKGYGNIVSKFSYFWAKNEYDFILALGDRFEMAAAVQATIPFGLKIAHLHGGETTLGAIDNIYRDQITLASKLHFVAAEKFVERVQKITGIRDNVYNVGALSLNDIGNLILPDWKEVCMKFKIPIAPFILVTVHPETVGYENNREYAEIISATLEALTLDYQVVITLSNADTMGSIYKKVFKKLKDKYEDKVSLIKSFGKDNYFSAMKSSEMLLGNTSSGILEAASFGKYVINLGDRQKGRLRNENVIDVNFDKNQILSVVKKISKEKVFRGSNKYYKANTAELIVDILLENK